MSTTQTCNTLKPQRLIDAERSLSTIETESFEAWKARQAANELAGVITAQDVATKANAILLRLKDLQSPSLNVGPAPGSRLGRISNAHVRLNNPRSFNGLAVKREMVPDKQWSEPARKVVDRATSEELKGFRFNAPRALPEDWEEFDTVVDETGKPVKVFKTRTQRLTRRANKLSLPSPTVLMDSQEDVIERSKTMQLVHNLWVTRFPIEPVVPLGRLHPDRLPCGISPFSASPQQGAPGPCSTPNLIETQGLGAYQQWRVLRAAGPVRPPVGV